MKRIILALLLCCAGCQTTKTTLSVEYIVPQHVSKEYGQSKIAVTFVR